MFSGIINDARKPSPSTLVRNMNVSFRRRKILKRSYFGNTWKHLDLVNRSPETTDTLLRLFQKLEKSRHYHFNSTTVKKVQWNQYRVWCAHPSASQREAAEKLDLDFTVLKAESRKMWVVFAGNFLGRTGFPLFYPAGFLQSYKNGIHRWPKLKYWRIRTQNKI